METIELPHLSEYPIYGIVFRDVSNASFLRDQLLQSNSAFEYAFIDAAMIISRDHVLAACFRAINDLANNRLKTRNVHSEIVFSFSPNNNITDSFRRFGISENTKDVVAIKVSTSPDIDVDSVTSHLKSNVQGTPVPLSDNVILEMRDLPRLRKVYKFEMKAAPKQGVSPPDEAYIFSVVTGSMALKGV